MTESFIIRLCVALALISFVLFSWANHTASKAAMDACLIGNSASTCHTLVE